MTIAFSTCYDGKCKDKSGKPPNIYLYNVDGGEEDQIKGGFSILKYDPDQKEVMYLTRKEWDKLEDYKTNNPMPDRVFTVSLNKS